MSVFFTALNQESLLNLQGPDALSFLQGQATGDTAALSTRKALPALICTPQGRVVADLMCHLTGADQLQIRVRASVAEILCDHLKKYILFSKAELTPVGDWVMAGCKTGTESAATGLFSLRDRDLLGASSLTFCL